MANCFLDFHSGHLQKKKLSWTKVANWFLDFHSSHLQKALVGPKSNCFLDFHNNDFGKSYRWTKVISEWLVGIFHSRECMLQNRFRSVLGLGVLYSRPCYGRIKHLPICSTGRIFCQKPNLRAFLIWKTVD